MFFILTNSALDRLFTALLYLKKKKSDKNNGSTI